MNERYEEQLERVIHRELQQLPPLEAPADFTEKVLAEALRRQAMPWWRKAFPNWPKAAQVLFILMSTACLYPCLHFLNQFGQFDAVNRCLNAVEPAATMVSACWAGLYSFVSLCAASVERLSPLYLVPVFAMLLTLGLSAFGALASLQRISSHKHI